MCSIFTEQIREVQSKRCPAAASRAIPVSWPMILISIKEPQALVYWLSQTLIAAREVGLPLAYSTNYWLSQILTAARELGLPLAYSTNYWLSQTLIAAREVGLPLAYSTNYWFATYDMIIKSVYDQLIFAPHFYDI